MLTAILVALHVLGLSLIGTAAGLWWLARRIDAATAAMCACIGDHDPEPDPAATSPEPTPLTVVECTPPEEYREAA